jgi:hypothetical protein
MPKFAEERVSDKTAPILHYSVSGGVHAVPSKHPAVSISPGAGLIAALFLSLGLWGAIWLAVSSLAAAWP